MLPSAGRPAYSLSECSRVSAACAYPDFTSGRMDLNSDSKMVPKTAMVSETSRVERWRGGLGLAYLCPALSSAGASLAAPCSVSTSRSSNRACEFPAHGSPTGFSRQHTMALSRSERDPANIAIFVGK